MSSALRWILSSQRVSGVWTRNICLAVSSTHSNRPGDTNSAVLRAMALGLARKAGHTLSTYNPRAQAYGHQPTSGVSPETQVVWEVWSETWGKNILPPYLSWRILTSDTGVSAQHLLGSCGQCFLVREPRAANTTCSGTPGSARSQPIHLSPPLWAELYLPKRYVEI